MGNRMAAMLDFFFFFKSDTRREAQGERDAQTCSSYTMHAKRIPGCVTLLTRAHRCPISVPLLQAEVLVAPLLSLSRTVRGEGTTSQCH